MKKLVLLVVLISTNISLISCTTDDQSDSDSLYENLVATEGDDGEIEKDPDEEEIIDGN